MNLILDIKWSTLWPKSLLGGACLAKSQSKIILSMPAEATYLQVGCKSKVIIDSLCPFRVLIKLGSS